MLELSVKTGRRYVPLFDLPVRLGRADAAREIGDTIDALISFVDDLGGDPDLERDDSEDGFEPHRPFALEGGPGCPISDAGGGNITDELHDDDDPAEDDDSDRCAAGDDHMIAGAVAQREHYRYRAAHDIGDDVDAEENGDTELNGDEGDHSGEPHA